MIVITEVKYKLELTKEEANWLKGHLQNPLHCQHPDEESEQDRTMRKLFWESLQ